MEDLNVVMRSAHDNSIFHGVVMPNRGPTIPHLFYVDDITFVGDWTSSNFTNLARILRYFHASSGLIVNFHKSKVYGIGLSDNEIDSCARILDCEAASLPFKYFGVPLRANMSLKKELAARN